MSSFIFSPDYEEDGTYPNSRLCKYSFPECPRGNMQQIFWSSGNFQLQDPYPGTPYCLDYVRFFLSPYDLVMGGATLDSYSLPDQILCGNQGFFHLEINNNKAIKVGKCFNMLRI